MQKFSICKTDSRLLIKSVVVSTDNNVLVLATHDFLTYSLKQARACILTVPSGACYSPNSLVNKNYTKKILFFRKIDWKWSENWPENSLHPFSRTLHYTIWGQAVISVCSACQVLTELKHARLFFSLGLCVENRCPCKPFSLVIFVNNFYSGNVNDK